MGFGLEEAIEKQEALLRQKQQQALSALLKRIQRDRNEQLKFSFHIFFETFLDSRWPQKKWSTTVTRLKSKRI